ncbi:helix-turn-helix transcriptional regulator [Motilimonas eburnea]|uniref:helix-turn-helix transcriptional regulator n=1 Tax=Motilimonas eburnea TaxID=1737488 RepID=UPI001E3127A0|nr:LuxR family transcriptional regulator [Motilimonas eburnea]MCE2572839.1 LuxR family transcriptional regulator [Motilimonas eburnea]
MDNNPLRQFILDLSASKSFEDCWSIYCNTLKKYGIIHVGYGVLPAYEADISQTIVHTNFPEEMVNYYIKNNGLAHDYLIRSNIMLNDTFIWISNEKERKRWLEKHAKQWGDRSNKTPFDLEESKKFQSFWQDFNVDNGLSFSFSRDVTLSGISLSATNMSRAHFNDHVLPHRLELKMLSEVFHQYSSSFSRNVVLNNANSSGVIPLTQMELDTLRWLASGVSLQVIADEKVFRSIESVNGYVRSAKTKLKAQSRDQLIAKALFLGII